MIYQTSWKPVSRVENIRVSIMESYFIPLNCILNVMLGIFAKFQGE